MKSTVRKFFRLLSGVEKYSLIVILVLMMLALMLQVFFRFVLNDPLLWSEEFARIMLIWLGLAGIGYGLKTDAHVKMEVFFNRMPPLAKKVVSVMIYLIFIACAFFLFPYALDFCRDQAGIKSSSMPLTYDLVFASLCVGLVLLVLHSIEGILETIWEGGDD